jgi:hypothetical protein
MKQYEIIKTSFASANSIEEAREIAELQIDYQILEINEIKDGA